MDINKVWLSGQVTTQPTLDKYGSGTPITRFTLNIKEKYVNRKGEDVFHDNFFRIESLGRSTEKIMDTVKKGSRYMVDGYLRSDRAGGKTEFKVRSFVVYPDESFDNQNYISGLSQALHILENSMDIAQAKEKLAVLLKNG